jgi:hypothetical protein
MCRSRSVLLIALAILLSSLFVCVMMSAQAGIDGSPPQGSDDPASAPGAAVALEPDVVAAPPQAAAEPVSTASLPQAHTPSEPGVVLRAASGATVLFMTQNGQFAGDVPPQMTHLPHLVLRRNGALTAPDERTLVVEVSGIEVPPAGAMATLQVETQHGDPDRGGSVENRITVWRESQQIANTSGDTQAGVVVVFRHAFAEAVAGDAGAVPTPTDYFRYEIAVTDAGDPAAGPLYAFSAEYGFLMEDQWVVQLPPVREASPGAAPDELVVHFCDMFPFQKNAQDPATWLPRGNVPPYVGAELLPCMIEAFRVESDDWGFPWHEAWTSYRPEDGPDRLSVALTEGRTWFYGIAPPNGHAGISINVTGGDNGAYDSLADGIMSTFYHELFHSLQRSLDQAHGGEGDVDGAEDAWRFFSEGTAVLASSVGQTGAQFSSGARAYLGNASRFIGGDGRVGDLNRSYERIVPHHAAPYFRFLYERCGGMANGVDDPAAGMRVIERTLAVLYSGEVVDIGVSTDLVGVIPAIMDRALAGSTCPFRTYEESLDAFARAIYALGLDGGRCTAPGIPDGCGLYDPYSIYPDPPRDTITYTGEPVTYALAAQAISPGIKSSFGIDLVEVVLDPAADGRPLIIEFHPALGVGAAFHVQLWRSVDPGNGAQPHRVAMPEMLVSAETGAEGVLRYTIPMLDTQATNRLGLIITRVDAGEGVDPAGAYTIVLRDEG